MIVLTTSAAESDILHSYDLQANCFITKPLDLDEYFSVVRVDRGLLAHHRSAAVRMTEVREAMTATAPSRTKTFQVLLVEDNPGDARLVQELLSETGSQFELSHVATLTDARHQLMTEGADCVLLDLSLPDASRLEAPMQLRAAAP